MPFPWTTVSLLLRPKNDRPFKSSGFAKSFGPRPSPTIATIIKLAEARQLATDALHDVAHGINPATKKKTERNSETFDYLASEYLERHAKTKKQSWEEDERIIRKDLLPAFGGTRAKDITRRDVRALLDRKAAMAPIMANRIRATLRTMFNWGIVNEIVDTNPVYLVPAPVKGSPPRPRLDRG